MSRQFTPYGKKISIIMSQQLLRRRNTVVDIRTPKTQLHDIAIYPGLLLTIFNHFVRAEDKPFYFPYTMSTASNTAAYCTTRYMSDI